MPNFAQEWLTAWNAHDLEALLPAPGGWNGITLAVSPEEVDATHHAALEAGAELISAPVHREWGGRSGYVADPEGNRWEIAWLPGFAPPPESL